MAGWLAARQQAHRQTDEPSAANSVPVSVGASSLSLASGPIDVEAVELHFSSGDTGMLGLQFPLGPHVTDESENADGSMWHVIKVLAGGLASEQARVNDELIAVNSLAVDSRPREEIISMLQRRPLTLLLWRRAQWETIHF
uniref:PDZ domain-containing protein n=1 Tax=Noctiluca scintillans TaxID=2966 RepID=A0A7S1AFN1_NOCSC|mmetsp:Transcript_44448/g.118005  ORF Transcript_44448/g.118005 Transcript_44448/m.118005 type:complete len:141 (+) Transcript_44448:56-478(+)